MPAVNESAHARTPLIEWAASYIYTEERCTIENEKKWESIFFLVLFTVYIQYSEASAQKQCPLLTSISYAYRLYIIYIKRINRGRDRGELIYISVLTIILCIYRPILIFSIQYCLINALSPSSSGLRILRNEDDGWHSYS